VYYRIWCSALVVLAVVGCGCVELRRELCAHSEHSAAPHNHRQQQPTHPGRTPHAVGHGLILLMMSIMMPETY